MKRTYSPVAMSIQDSMTIKLMVPKEYTKEDLPNPNQSGIEIIFLGYNPPYDVIGRKNEVIVELK